MANDSTKTEVQQKIEDFFHEFRNLEFGVEERVLSADDLVDSIFYLESGVVQQVGLSGNGQKNVITLFKPGSFFPLIWGLKNENSPYDFETLTNVVAWKAPAAKVAEFLQTNADVSYSLSLRLMSALEGMSKVFQRSVSSSSRQRLVQLLVTLSYRLGEEKKSFQGQGVEITLKLTQNSLAEMVGLSRETVSRLFQQMSSEGLVQVKNQRYILPDRAKLERML